MQRVVGIDLFDALVHEVGHVRLLNTGMLGTPSQSAGASLLTRQIETQTPALLDMDPFAASGKHPTPHKLAVPLHPDENDSLGPFVTSRLLAFMHTNLATGIEMTLGGRIVVRVARMFVTEHLPRPVGLLVVGDGVNVACIGFTVSLGDLAHGRCLSNKRGVCFHPLLLVAKNCGWRTSNVFRSEQHSFAQEWSRHLLNRKSPQRIATGLMGLTGVTRCSLSALIAAVSRTDIFSVASRK